MQLETGPMSSMSYRIGYKPHDAKTKHKILSLKKYHTTTKYTITSFKKKIEGTDPGKVLKIDR